jgi:hypothetical protein
MPYKNIIFVKLEKRMLNDWRFYMMSESAQLNWCRFLMLAGETKNKIPLDPEAIRMSFRTSQDVDQIKKTIEEIQRNLPKFKRGKRFYYIEGFTKYTNYIPEKENLRKSRGNPKDALDQDQDQIKIRQDKESDPVGLLTKDILNGFKPKELELLRTRIEQYLKHPVGTEANDGCLKELLGRVHAAVGVKDKMAYAVKSIQNWSQNK